MTPEGRNLPLFPEEPQYCFFFFDSSRFRAVLTSCFKRAVCCGPLERRGGTSPKSEATGGGRSLGAGLWGQGHGCGEITTPPGGTFYTSQLGNSLQAGNTFGGGQPPLHVARQSVFPDLDVITEGKCRNNHFCRCLLPLKPRSHGVLRSAGLANNERRLKRGPAFWPVGWDDQHGNMCPADVMERKGAASSCVTSTS